MRDAKQRLRQLDRIEPPDVWRRATSLEPVGDVPPGPQPSWQGRVAAGAVALAVFAAAVALGLGVLGRDPGSPLRSTPVVDVAVVTLNSGDGDPFASLEYRGTRVEGFRAELCWEERTCVRDLADPPFDANDFVAIPQMTPLEVRGDAASFTTTALSWGNREMWAPLDDGSRLSPDPGRYVLEIDATWPEGSASISFPIEVTPPIDEASERPPTRSPEPAELDPIEVTTPARGDDVTSPVTIAGTADVFEATVSIQIFDGTNNLIAETFTTATCGSGCRGDFSIDVPFSVGSAQSGVIHVFELSAMDGKKTNVVRIPVTLQPGAGDPIADAVEGVWSDVDGTPLPDGSDPDTDFGLVMNVHEGHDHCGWTSVTFMNLGWPLGTQTEPPGDSRQYLRDPQGVLAEFHATTFGSRGAFPDDAEPTGFHRGDWELWTAPSDVDEAVYVVSGDPRGGGTWERWPRSTEVIGCD